LRTTAGIKRENIEEKEKYAVKLKLVHPARLSYLTALSFVDRNITQHNQGEEICIRVFVYTTFGESPLLLLLSGFF
jgi:hypothetical protein